MIAKIALVTVLALASQDGCSDRGSIGGGDKPVPPMNGPVEVESWCSLNSFAVIPHHPHQSSRKPEFMVGKAWVTCSQAISSLTIEVKIQRQLDNSSWIDHSRMPNVCGPYPVKAGEKKTCQHGDAPCPKGYPSTKFRTAARAEGVHEGKPAGMTNWKFSGPALVPCGKEA